MPSIPQSTELTRGTTELKFSTYIMGSFIDARALTDINLISFGYIACLSHWGGGGHFTYTNDYYLHSLPLEEGGLGSAPCDPYLDAVLLQGSLITCDKS